MSLAALQHVHVPPTDERITGTLLLLHGTGGDEHDLLPLAPLVAPGARAISPRGAVLEHGMPRFFRRLAEGVFDLDDLRVRTDELADFLAAAAHTYGFDASQVTAIGFSNGANIATALLLQRPEALAGAVLLRPMLAYEPATVPPLAGRRVLVASGQRDPIAPPEHGARLARLLRGAGADVSEAPADAAHTLTRADVAAAHDWWREGRR